MNNKLSLENPNNNKDDNEISQITSNMSINNDISNTSSPNSNNNNSNPSPYTLTPRCNTPLTPNDRLFCNQEINKIPEIIPNNVYNEIFGGSRSLDWNRPISATFFINKLKKILNINNNNHIYIIKGNRRSESDYSDLTVLNLQPSQVDKNNNDNMISWDSLVNSVSNETMINRSDYIMIDSMERHNNPRIDKPALFYIIKDYFDPILISIDGIKKNMPYVHFIKLRKIKIGKHNDKGIHTSVNAIKELSKRSVTPNPLLPPTWTNTSNIPRSSSTGNLKNPNRGGKRKTIKKRKWSKTYKKKINCKKPKGFSQKQFCKYRTRKTKNKNKNKTKTKSKNKTKKIQ